MHIADSDTEAIQILGQHLCHSLCKRRYEHSEALGGCGSDLAYEVIHLTLYGLYCYHWVNQACRSDYLLSNRLATRQFIFRGRSAYAYQLVYPLLKLIKLQRSVIPCRLKSKAVFDKYVFSRLIAKVHTSNLWYRNVGFVYKHQIILGKIIEQCKRRLTGLPSVKVSRIILDALTVANLAHHIYIVHGSLLKPLCLNQLVVFPKLIDFPFKVGLNLVDCFIHILLIGRIMGCGKQHHMRQFAFNVSVYGADLANALYLVPKEYYSKGFFLSVDREYLNDITSNSEYTTRKLNLISLVLHIYELSNDMVSVNYHVLTQRKALSHIFCGVSQGIDAGYRCDNYYISALIKRRCCAMPKSVYLIIYRSYFIYVGIR